MIHLGRFSLAATGIVMGGVTLGAALSAFANPLPKAAPPTPWEHQLSPHIAAGVATPYYESLPQDLYPANLPGSYAPARAFTELPWPTDLQFASYDGDRAPPAPEPVRVAAEEVNYDRFADRPIEVPHYAAIEQAAAEDSAPTQLAVTEEASELTVPVDRDAPPPLPADAGSAKLIHIAAAGD